MILCALLSTPVSSFVVPIQINSFIATQTSSTSSLNMGGFGGGGTKKGGKKVKKVPSVLKLKPKSQWDKYLNLKKASSVKVAVRVATNSESDIGEWYEVGKIKSDGDEFTESAVIVQRAIIAEHAKRLHPLKVLPKDKVEWAYASKSTPEQEDWIAVNKDTASAPSGIEKKVGFQGNPDPSGFYSKLANSFDQTSSTFLASGSDVVDRSVLPRVK